MSTSELFTSVDRIVAEARAMWQGEKAILEQRILTLETELALRTSLHDRAIESKDNALKQTATLMAQFGVVAQVFDDARRMAIEAGFYSDPTTKSPLIDEAREAVMKKAASAEKLAPVEFNEANNV
jgi:hypothetical protein